MSECNNSSSSLDEISQTWKANIDYICSIKYSESSGTGAELEMQSS